MQLLPVITQWASIPLHPYNLNTKKFSMTWLSKIPVTTPYIPLQISTDEVKYNEVLVTRQLQN
jgi:hypothetical protein